MTEKDCLGHKRDDGQTPRSHNIGCKIPWLLQRRYKKCVRLHPLIKVIWSKRLNYLGHDMIYVFISFLDRSSNNRFCLFQHFLNGKRQ